jgi:hypothetical protein
VNATHEERHFLNLYAIQCSELLLEFRELQVDGLPTGDNQYQTLQQLKTKLSYEIQQPIAILPGSSPRLAIPAHVQLLKREYQLSPHVVSLKTAKDKRVLDFGAVTDEKRPLAKEVLRFALTKPLMKNRNLWGRARRWSFKDGIEKDGVVSYPGFAWQVIDLDGVFYLVVDPKTKYVAANPLNGSAFSDWEEFRFKRCLYRFGDSWYEVQIFQASDRAIRDQRFVTPDGDTHDVYTYTKKHAPGRTPWIRDLDPDGPSVIYHYPNNSLDRFGALELCWPTVRTDDPRIARRHREAALRPSDRFKRSGELLDTFSGAEIIGNPLTIDGSPVNEEPGRFPLPALQFGRDAKLQIASGDVKAYPTLRLTLLTDKEAGPLDRSSFGPQFLVVPQSQPRRINEDFQGRLVQAMKRISHDPDYGVELVVYDDTQARTLNQYISALKESLARAGAKSGYGLLVLPSRCPSDLHHYVKSDLQPELQFKCANASKIGSFYDGAFKAVTLQAGKYGSYVMNCAIGVMLVNRKWLWSLLDPLNHDLHIGLDVLHGQAGLTFLYDAGRRIYFDHRVGARPERMSAAQLRTAIFEGVTSHGRRGNDRPSSILVTRDGRLFDSERKGIRDAVRDLQKSGFLPLDVSLTFAEVHKATMNHLRLVSGTSEERLNPAQIGSYRSIGDSAGILCTTGYPFRTPGTPKPLYIEVSGQSGLVEVLQDLFGLAQLGFSAPTAATRLPITLKLADDFLESVAADYDVEASLYDSDPLQAEGA